MSNETTTRWLISYQHLYWSSSCRRGKFNTRWSGSFCCCWCSKRYRDIKRKQFDSPWVRVLKIWYDRSYKADSNRTYKEELNCAGGGPVQKMLSFFFSWGVFIGGAVLLFKYWPKTLCQTNIYPYLLKRLLGRSLVFFLFFRSNNSNGYNNEAR